MRAPSRREEQGHARAHTFTPARTEAYETTVALIARAAAARAGWMAPAEGVPLELHVQVFRTVRRGDWDNYGKSIADALTKAGVWADDRYVESASVRLFVDIDRPRVEVLVRELVASGCNDCYWWAPLGKPCPAHDDGRGLEVVG